MKFQIGDKVILKTFWGTYEALEDVDDNENYWKLLNYSGTVIKYKKEGHKAFPEMGEQVLIQFNENIENLNLYIHNEIKNTLWIFTKDLIKKD